jgi:hypothetical protein
VPAAVVLLALGAPLAASAEAAPLVEYERVVNGNFDSGAPDPWWAGPGTLGRVTAGEFCVDVTGGTANGWEALWRRRWRWSTGALATRFWGGGVPRFHGCSANSVGAGSA